MATIGQSNLNLLDIAKLDTGRGDIADVIEVLAQQNPIVEDAVAMECNMGTIHRQGIRTGLPTVTWGALYQGIPQSKSRTQQVDDTTGFVEGLSSVDERLLEISKNPAKVRLSEGKSFLEAMNQEVSTGFFYHNTATTPEKIKGLGARYNTLANSQVINAGGASTDNTSIWFVTWGEDYTSLIYPEGTTAGLHREDMGRQRVNDANGNPYYVKEELFRWHLGVSVKDWRYNARIANIDVSDLIAGTVDIYKFMRRAYYRLQSRRVPGGRQVIYMNRDAMEALDAMATPTGTAQATALQLARKEIQGQEVLMYRGIPIRETDAILNTEAALT
jgi:hypothetical protein